MERDQEKLEFCFGKKKRQLLTPGGGIVYYFPSLVPLFLEKMSVTGNIMTKTAAEVSFQGGKLGLQ